MWKLGFMGFFALIPTLSQGHCCDKSLLYRKTLLKGCADILVLCCDVSRCGLFLHCNPLNYNKFIFQLGFGEKKTQYLVFSGLVEKFLTDTISRVRTDIYAPGTKRRLFHGLTCQGLTLGKTDFSTVVGFFYADLIDL